MTTHITLSTLHGAVEIELLQNQFVDFWYNHYQSMISQYSVKARPTRWPYYRDCDTVQVDKIVTAILDVIERINSADYLTPLPETVTRQQLLALDINTQQVLNRLHRYAVVCSDYRDRWCQHGPVEFEWIDWNNEEFMYVINVLNQSIHQLEDYVVTPHKQEFLESIQTVEFVFQSSMYRDVDVFAIGADLAVPEEMQKHLRLTGYDVWVKKDLLGKDFVTAFADHDDATQFDIRPQTIISGGIAIDVNSWREDFFNSQSFTAWLGQTPADCHGSYPLGRVIAGKQHLLKTFNITGGP
jgi:hypothetical protein